MKVKIDLFINNEILIEWPLDDIRGLVVATTSEGINEAARDQASRQQILRVFLRYILLIER